MQKMNGGQRSTHRVLLTVQNLFCAIVSKGKSQKLSCLGIPVGWNMLVPTEVAYLPS